MKENDIEREDLQALAELGVRAGFVLVPAVPEPSLDLPHLPVQLLGEAVQMAGVWALWAEEDTTEFRVKITINYSQTLAAVADSRPIAWIQSKRIENESAERFHSPSSAEAGLKCYVLVLLLQRFKQ